jgi:A/G-specific adenine glycosylase
VSVDILEFQETIWQKANELYRDMPWRTDTRPYYVLVSEIMLQQTQVDRVIPKFEAFIQAFPTIEALSKASLSDVLQLWSGLGYNRRAKFLHEAARRIISEYNGVFPTTKNELMTLPGVGVNTAGALLAYSFNQPSIFIETNVRTVYFYHYFLNREDVTDAELTRIVEATVDAEHPREWYWAIMDYGSYLKRQGVGFNNKSRHYKKQSPLKGSVREVRGQIIKLLTAADLTEHALRQLLTADERFEPALRSLESDGLIHKTNQTFHLKR